MILKKYKLIYIALIIISIKWLISFIFFIEPIDLRIIFESVTDGKYYYPLIKYLSEFRLNYSFDPEINDLKIIPIPFTSLFFHAFLFNLLNFYSFIFLEFIALAILLAIFYNFYRIIFSKDISLFLTLLLIVSPIIIKNTFFFDIQYLKIFSTNLFDFRVPRPMISNLFLFGFVFLVSKMYIKKFYSYKNFILVGLILGLSLSSFFYHFFLEIIVLLILLIIKFKKDFFNEITANFKFYFISILSCFLISIPFLINLMFHETDFTSRQCVFNLNYDIKITLLKFYLTKYFNLKFLIIIFFITSTMIYANLKKIKNQNIINLLYVFFVSSLLTPFVFISLSSKSCVLYHFNNLIIIFGVLYLILFFQIILKPVLEKKRIKKFTFFCSIILVFIYCLNFYTLSKKKFNDQNYNEYRTEFKIFTDKIRKLENFNKSSILTFDTNFMIWAILNDIKYLNLINGLFTSKKDFMIEEDIFAAFKILGLDKNNLKKFLKNDNNKSQWRYLNNNMTTFFFYKYQANSLVTFNKSKDFNKEEKNYINKSSPLLHQQSIIPIFEKQRLIDNFMKYENKIKNPDILILNKNENFYNPEKINLDNFCLSIDGKKLMLFLKKTKYKCENEN